MKKIFAFLRRNKWKSLAGFVILVLVGLGIMSASQPAEPEYLTVAAERGDIRQTVEAVGTVVSERELELRFSGVGVVSQVLVSPGQRVRAGQRLAQLKAGNLGASIAAQQASLQSALAELRSLEEGTRPEDIAVAEADVAAKKAALQVAKASVATAEQNIKTAESQLLTLEQEAQVGLSGQVSTSLSTLSQEIVDAENALALVDDMIERLDIQEAIDRSDPGADEGMRIQRRAAQDALDQARRDATAATDYQGALNALATGRSAFGQVSAALNSLYQLIGSLRETSAFSQTTREAYKAEITPKRSAVETSVSALTSADTALKNASAGYDTKISSQRSTIQNLQGTRDKSQTDILTYEAAIRTAEAQLALKKAGTRKADVDAARARVRAAQANLARAHADFSDTVLTAPINGTVTHVNVKLGEALPADAAVTLLGDSPFRVEMFVSEIDVPKLQLTQSGSIEFEAFRDVRMKLVLSQVDAAPTLKDGVSKYGAKLDFRHPHPELKIGMTGDAEILTGSRQNAVFVPRRAVLDDTRGSYVRILNADGKTIEERTVTTGMEGESGDVEILSGLQEGETVIVLIKK